MRCIAFHSFLSKGSPGRKLVSSHYAQGSDCAETQFFRENPGEILGEVKISSQVTMQTDHFLSNKIVQSKYVVLNWSTEGSWGCGAPWLCGAWGAAWNSQQSQLQEEHGAVLAGWFLNPAGLPKPLLQAHWHCWHCLPVETFGGFKFLGKKPRGVLLPQLGQKLWDMS